MKKILIVSMAALFLASCGGSKKGAWSDDDKEKFQSKCKSELGTIAGDQTQKVCDCLTGKIENEFDSYEEADKGMDSEAGKKIAMECMSDLFKDAMKDIKVPETNTGSEETIENPADDQMPADELSEEN